MPSLGSGLSLGTLNRLSGEDYDASAYIQTAGIADAVTKAKINSFVIGVKNLGLWSSFICWPLKSSQNKGSGTIAYSLGGFGPYNGSFVSSPTWGVDGVTFNGSNSIGLSTSIGTSRVNKFSIGVGKITGYSSNRFFDIQDGGSNTRRNPLLAVGSFGSFDVAFSLPNSGVSAPETNAFTSNLPQNTYYSVIGRTTGSSMFVYRDKVQKGTLTGQTFNQGSSYNSTGIGVAYIGTIAFVALAGEDTTEAQAFALNDLYYSTLGNNRDADADSYILRAGVTDATSQTQINNFVVGAKSLGVWNNMNCWLFRSSQNVGSGTTAYNLGGLGTFNGTLVNGPTWGADGIVFDGNNDYITLPDNAFSSGNSAESNWAFIKPNASTNNAVILGQGDPSGNPTQNYYHLKGGGTGNDSATMAFFDSPIASSDTSWKSLFQGNTANGFKGKNGGSVTSFTFGNTLNKSGKNCTIGAFPAFGGWYQGTISAIIKINATPTTQLNSDIYNLYKTTLGIGLGLP
jgi:hypothetical protein